MASENGILERGIRRGRTRSRSTMEISPSFIRFNAALFLLCAILTPVVCLALEAIGMTRRRAKDDILLLSIGLLSLAILVLF